MVPEHQGILGVDLDGVCADFYALMREIAAEWLEKDVSDLTEDVSWGLKEWGIPDLAEYRRLHHFAVTQRGLFERLSIIAGARRVLRKLSNEKYRIRIITHRLVIQHFHAVAAKQTINWLDKNGIPYWDLCFLKEKEQVGADIYIEDTPQNIETLRDMGLRVICFANSTNKNVDDPRADNWDDVYSIVKEILPPK